MGKCVLTVTVATAAFALALLLRDVLNVWLVTGLGAVVALALSRWTAGVRLRKLLAPTLREVITGAGLGAGLVVLTHVVYRFAVDLIPFLDGMVEGLYGDLQVPPGPVAALPVTVVVILAEEVVWRGVLVEELRGRDTFRGRPALLVLVATAIYAIPHLLAQDFVLMAAALILGALWTALRLVTGGLVAPLACHLVWSCTLFALWPLT